MRLRGCVQTLLLLALAVAAGAATVPLSNGDFSLGTAGWSFWTVDSGAGAFSVDGGQGRIDISVPGANTWSVGLSHPGLAVVQAHKYRVDFKAQADAPLSLYAEVHQDREPWPSYSGSSVFSLTSSLQAFSFSFSQRADSDPAAALQFTAGGQAATALRLDDVTVTDLGVDDSVPVFPPDLSDVAPDKSLADCTVFSFSQVIPGQTADELFALKPDLNIRTVGKFGTQGQKPGDYKAGDAAKYHQFGTLFMAGISSFIQSTEFSDPADFQAMVSRDAAGDPVSWATLLDPSHPDPTLYRGALAVPRYRQYLIATCKMLIDLGADGIHFDESNQSYVGGPSRNWTDNEGFDDASIADFNRYLIAKYPAYSAADWKSRFGMDDANLIHPELPPEDLDHNFNYRRYLQAHGWAGSSWGSNTPFEAANPLAPEWGRQESNRLFNNGSFTDTCIRKYLKEIFDAVRAYGRERYGKRVYCTANGRLPEVDLHSFGVYEPNKDAPGGANMDLLPVSGGALDGGVSLMDSYKRLYGLSRQAAGDAPLVLFLDWPNQEINRYYALPLPQKKDFWRIYAAEAYAAGCYYAFHLSNVMPGEPTAEQSGVLDFFKDYAQYYRDHADLYHGNAYSDAAVSLDRDHVSYNLMAQAARSRQVLHLINHHYSGAILPQRDIQAVVDADAEPARVSMVSPDFPGERELDHSFAGGKLSIRVSELQSYDAVIIQAKTPEPGGAPSGAAGPAEVLEARPTPNPVRGPVWNLSVRLSAAAQSLQVGLYSAAQVRVWQQDFRGPFNAGWNRLTWALPGLAAGNYVLTVGAEGRRRGPAVKVYLLPPER